MWVGKNDGSQENIAGGVAIDNFPLALTRCNCSLETGDYIHYDNPPNFSERSADNITKFIKRGYRAFFRNEFGNIILEFKYMVANEEYFPIIYIKEPTISDTVMRLESMLNDEYYDKYTNILNYDHENDWASNEEVKKILMLNKRHTFKM